MLYLAKYLKLKMFPVQIQWEFVSAVPFSSAAAHGWGKHSDGIAPDCEKNQRWVCFVDSNPEAHISAALQ